MRASRLLLAFVVLAAGLCAALPFQHRHVPRAAATPPDSPLELNLRATDSNHQLTAVGGISPATDLDALAAINPAPAATANHALSSRPDLRDLAPPPPLPISFQSRPASSGQAANEWRPGPALTALYRRLAVPPDQTRAYRVRDGDTLESIAERFLGSRERADEIFARNRNVLTAPDLLPVGATIRLPPRENSEAAHLTPAERSRD